MKLFLSPHPDDETLFGAYKINRILNDFNRHSHTNDSN
jgi:hypothetical protein